MFVLRLVVDEGRKLFGWLSGLVCLRFDWFRFLFDRLVGWEVVDWWV